MEQIQEQMRENQGKKNALRNIRALERQRKMPQNLLSTELEPSEKKYRGGNMAGLNRVVGAGKRRSRSASSDSMSDEEDKKMEGGAYHQGKMMAEHIKKLHGEGFFSDFWDGFKSVVAPVANVASFIPGPIGMVGKVASGLLGNGKVKGGSAPRNQAPMGVEVSHAPMTPAMVGLPGQALGGQDVPPGGMVPRAYGTAPQAPAHFQRNSVSLGSEGLLPNAQVGSGRRKKHSAPSVHSTMNEMEGGVVLGRPGHGIRGLSQVVKAPAPAPAPMAGGKRAQRGQMISKLMKEKGMTLPQASKYLKEHGSA